MSDEQLNEHTIIYLSNDNQRSFFSSNIDKRFTIDFIKKCPYDSIFGEVGLKATNSVESLDNKILRKDNELLQEDNEKLNKEINELKKQCDSNRNKLTLALGNQNVDLPMDFLISEVKRVTQESAILREENEDNSNIIKQFATTLKVKTFADMRWDTLLQRVEELIRTNTVVLLENERLRRERINDLREKQIKNEHNEMYLELQNVLRVNKKLSWKEMIHIVDSLYNVGNSIKQSLKYFSV